MLGNKVKSTFFGEKSSGQAAPENDARKLDQSIKTFQEFERTPIQAVVTVKQCGKDPKVFNRLLTETNHQWNPEQVKTINKLDSACQTVYDVSNRDHELFTQRVGKMKDDIASQRAAATNSTMSR